MQRYLGGYSPAVALAAGYGYGPPTYKNTVDVKTLPASVNWTDSGVATPVRNQVCTTFDIAISYCISIIIY